MSTQFKTKMITSARSMAISQGMRKAKAKRKAKKMLAITLTASIALTAGISYLASTYMPINHAIAPVALAEPIEPAYKAINVPIGNRTITMYTSRPEETDATPCIGASGQDVCVLHQKGQNLCATNEFPLGTVLDIEGLGECIVHDRMNSRYTTNIDWYAGYDDDCLDGYDTYDVCPNLKKAKKFGAPSLSVSILK